MSNSAKNAIIAFSLSLLIGGLIHIIAPAPEGRLSWLPKITVQRLFNGRLFPDLEKALWEQFSFQQKEYNGVYVVDEGLYKIQKPLNEAAVANAARRLNALHDLYLQDMNVYYAVIPNKNYFAPAQKDLAMDYDAMIAIMNEDIVGMTYIDLFSPLSLSDYFRTDIHWRQERILHVADMLLLSMGADALPDREYTRKEIKPFHGSLHGQAARDVPPDTLVYLTNDIIEGAVVYDYEQKSYGKVYDLEKAGEEPYNVFLSGAKPLLTIENPACTNGRELILFRDSFGSSIAPLLLESYSKITMVDLRFISSGLLEEYVQFTPNQDVLFLYCTEVINNSWMLR